MVAGGSRTSTGAPGWSRTALATAPRCRTVASSSSIRPSGRSGGGPSMSSEIPTRSGRWAAASPAGTIGRWITGVTSRSSRWPLAATSSTVNGETSPGRERRIPLGPTGRVSEATPAELMTSETSMVRVDSGAPSTGSSRRARRPRRSTGWWRPRRRPAPVASPVIRNWRARSPSSSIHGDWAMRPRLAESPSARA